MADQNTEFGPNLISLMDEEGNEHEFEFVDSLELEGSEYVALIPVYDNPADSLEDDGELVVLKVMEENGEEYLEAIEDEDEFDEVAPSYEQDGYKCYYFGETGDGPTDGSMRTGRTTVDLGGENFTFYFETSGGDRGAGVTGEQDNRYYQSGKLLSAGTDERFQVVQRTRTGTDPDNGRPIYSYTLLDDVDEFIAVVNSDEAPNSSVETVDLSDFAETDDMGDEFGISNLNQDAGDLDELYILRNTTTNAAGETRTSVGLDEDEFFLVNTSGRVVDNRGRSRDGNDYYFVTGSNGQILAVYLEN